MSEETKRCPNCGAKIDIRAEICPRCGVRVKEPPKQSKGREKVSNWWWLLPIFLTWIGGLIAWVVNKDKNPGKAKKMLILGIVITAIAALIPLISILYYYGLFSAPMGGGSTASNGLIATSQSGFLDIGVADWKIGSDGELKLKLENKVPTTVKIVGIDVNGNLNPIPPDLTLETGERMSSFVEVPNTGIVSEEEDTSVLEVVIKYKRTDAMSTTVTSSGRLSITRS